MKIIVNNEREKELLLKFIEALDEQMLDTMQYEDEKYARENDDTQYLDSDDYDFLKDGFYNCKIEVDNSVRELCIEHWNITGICTVCGCETTGTIDGEDIGYYEWLEMQNKSNLECETCYFKERE